MEPDDLYCLETVPYRIRIGVTGHRRLDNPEAVAEKVREFLRVGYLQFFDARTQRFIASTPRTPIAFSVITPLAEGADRLVAREVLGSTPGGVGSIIEVVLPLVKDDYLEDFETAASRAEFESLLSMDRNPEALRSVRLVDELPGPDRAELRAQARNRAYFAAGRYVVNRCDILLALWDGEASRGVGGTADIVAYARKRQRPVYVVSTRAPHTCEVFKGTGLHGKSLLLTEAFNTATERADAHRQRCEREIRALFDNPEGHAISPAVRKTVSRWLIPTFVKADRLALRNQAAYLAVGTLVYALSTVAVGVVALGALFHEWSAIAFSVEFALLAVILAMVYRANWLEVHKRWIECRFLAERIRSAIFFTVSGVAMPPARVPPYMGGAHHPNHWMIKVFAEVARRLPPAAELAIDPVTVYKPFVRVRWIEDQVHFHATKVASSGRMNLLLEQACAVVFMLALAAAGSHLVFLVGSPPRPIETLVTFLAIVLPAIGAGLGGLRSHREYSRIQKRSSNMQLVLDDILDQLDHTESKEDFSRLLIEIGELMLRETQDWLMLMKFAELKPSA
jgi:hypothetical protein